MAKNTYSEKFVWFMFSTWIFIGGAIMGLYNLVIPPKIDEARILQRENKPALMRIYEDHRQGNLLIQGPSGEQEERYKTLDSYLEPYSLKDKKKK